MPAGVTANVDQRYSTNGRFDLYRSAKPTGALVVILPGRTSDKGIYSVFAGALATKGATVVVANYRARDLPPAPQTDLRCALATAVAGASKWGADPAKLVLVGVTWGVIPAIGEALDGPWKAYDAPTDCLIDPSGTKAVVRGVVGIVGQYDYYGASGDQTDNFKTFSPFSQLTSARKVPLRLLHGQLDDAKIAPSVTENFQQALQSNGFDSVAEISQLPNLALIGTRYDKTTKAAVAVSTLDPNALEPAVRLTLGLAG